MIAYVPGFNLGKSIVASFSAGEETDSILQPVSLRAKAGSRRTASR